MNRPVHFDVDKVVAETEAMIAETIAKARAGAKSDADRRLVDFQEKVCKAILVLDRAMVEARNEGLEPYIVGQALTSPMVYVMNALKNNFPPDAYGNFAMSLTRMLTVEPDGGKNEGLIIGGRVTEPIVGGNA